MKTDMREKETIHEFLKSISEETETKKRKNGNHPSRDKEKTSPDGNYLFRDGRHFWRVFLAYGRKSHIYNTVNLH
jgi:hypothetical protein